ncbi:MAG: tetratricopeptide repeat protein [Syntrophobacterales bacterium]|nr:tetratricopeptide repeat protein [Syntrophobacterales bacterium]
MSAGKYSLAEVQELLQAGHLDQARDLALSRHTREVRDATLHLAWADLLEELGLVEEVILELNLAIRDDPERLENYRRLAEIYLDQGQPLKAAHVWGSLVKQRPQEPQAYVELARALEEAGEFAKAKSVYQTGREKTGAPVFEGLLAHLGFLEEPAEPSPLPPDAGQILPQPHHLVVYVSLFSGREGVYARQWVSPTGESGYTPVQEPLTPKVAENHILGNYTIGVYPVRLDNTVNFIVFDLDLAKFAVNRAITSRRTWEAQMAKVHQAACRLLDAAAAQDLPAYLEDSGFKGRHVWIFLEAPMPAGVARKCGQLLAASILPLTPEVTLEVFPRQATVKPGSLGNLIKLPLGIHRRTGQRALFISPDGQPYDDQLKLLEQFQRVPKSHLYRVVQALLRTQAAPSPAGPAPAPEPDREPAPASEIYPPPAPETPYDPERDVPLQFLLSRCPALKALVDQVHRTSRLSRYETQVLIHTLGHLEHGPEAVNYLFERCLHADPALFLKSRLRGHPMSCPKIRARIPHLTSTVDCNCTFDLATNLYPTPLIHLQALGPPAAAPGGLSLESLQFKQLLQDYLKLRQQLRETQLLLARYEDSLARFFEEAGVEAVDTSLGRLRCRKTENGKASFTLEI